MFRVIWLCLSITIVCADYWSSREQLIQAERSHALGSKLALSPLEQLVNRLLLRSKHKELDHGLEHPDSFAPAQHFFKAKPLIESSEIFQFIRSLPKGGALHGHDFGLVDIDFVLNVTYRDNLYLCQEDGRMKFGFLSRPVQNECYKLVKTLREQAKSAQEFDAWLKTKMSLVCEDPARKYPDINSVWNKFMDVFDTIVPLLTYRPVFHDYFYQTLQEFYDDGVKYMEIRGILPVVYDLVGWPSNPIQVVGIMSGIVDEFKEEHSDFIGAKFIYAPPRLVDNDTMKDYIEMYKAMENLYPDFLAGFDLVGQEDSGVPLIKFIGSLNGEGIRYFFHAGETNWNGMTDDNLIDAVLLNTSRIGHGFAIVKHPGVMEEVKKRGIAIEVNPISNQVLKLVDDLRNHPASVLLAQDFPVVVSSDDPGLWGARGLSHDFYEVFMGIAHRDDGLGTLKQLAINSIKYSALSDEDKEVAMGMWQKDWDKFIIKSIVNHINQPKTTMV